MSSKIEESVLDFDLQLLHQTHNNYATVPPPCKGPKDKQRMALFLVKSKIIATDSVLRKYHATREILDQTQHALYTSMDECKQICIDQRNTLEKCANLEEDVKTLQKQNQILEQKAVALENRCEGLMCHTNQLQVLVKEYETQIEGFKIENKLETTSVKDIEKKYESMKKEKNLLMKDIGALINVVLQKKKPGHKEKILLDKYKKLMKISQKSSGDNVDIFDDALSHSFSDESMNDNEEVQNGNTDSDHINDKGKLNTNYNLLSVDTGRGSSLESSESEKCNSSPDYFSVDSPTNIFVSKPTKKVQMMDIATSPSPEVVTVDRAVSPIFSRKEDRLPKIMIDRAISPTIFIQSASPIFDQNRTGSALTDRPLELTTRNIATSPIMNFILNDSLTESIPLRALILNQKEAYVKNTDRAVSSLKLITNDKTKSPLMNSVRNISPTFFMENQSPLTFEYIQTNNGNESSAIISDKTTNHKIDFRTILTIPNKEPIDFVCKESHNVKILQEKACLELNNSCNVFKQQHNDEEIEMILKEMRLTQELITPIPKTPARSYNSEKRDATSYSCNESCQEAAKIREENKALNLTVSSLVKEVVSIKSLLKTHILIDSGLNYSFQEHNSNNISTNTDDRFSDTIVEGPTHNLSVLPQNDLCVSENMFSAENVRDATELFESPLSERSESNINFEDDAICNDLSIDGRQIELIKDTVMEECIESQSKDKRIKRKKLTKLDKLKKKLIPKQKIQSAKPTPVKKLRLKPKKVLVPNAKVINGTSSEALNDKVAYQKAVQVIAELNAKKKASITPIKAKKIDDSSLVDKDSADINEITSLELDVSNNIDIDHSVKESLRRSITTRSQRKQNAIGTETVHIEASENKKTAINKSKENVLECVKECVQKRRGVKRASIDNPDIGMKRILRSSTVRKSDNVSVEDNKPVNADKNIQSSQTKSQHSELVDNILNNNNLIRPKTPILCSMEQCTKTLQAKKLPFNPDNPHDNALCFTIQKYGLTKIKNCVKVSDNMIESAAKKMEDDIEKILEMPASDSKAGMDKLVDDLKKMNLKHFVLGLMKYLNNPTRKVELFTKVCIPPAPPMTKSEQILLYILTHLRDNWSKVDVVNFILDNIEYALFKLNRTPGFDIIESMAHFYAVLCRYNKARNRLRIFIMDAMYCIQFKSIPLIKQCMDVWMHILPLSHMGIAKAPLVTCLVYLLHFFKCEDKFNRVQEIRHILKHKYFYQFTDWNESKILELFKSAIHDVSENRDEQKMLRMALILLAKRQGPKWCQNNLIRNVLIPFIEKQDVLGRVKEFCVSVVGPLLKPYPVEMRVHCEITMNQIMDLLDQNTSTSMQEAIYTSLIYMYKHNPHRVLKALILWKPTVMSIEMEGLLKDFVREKPVKLWKIILSKVPLTPR